MYLHDYMSTINLQEILQSAYKKLHSTEMALLRVHNDLLKDVDNRKTSVLILLDLSAAFDTVDHEILLHTLESNLGFTGKVLIWFRL